MTKNINKGRPNWELLNGEYSHSIDVPWDGEEDEE